MKAVAFLAVLLGLVAVGFSLFSLAVTHPPYESAKNDLKSIEGSKVAQSAPDREEIEVGRKALDLQHYVTWGTGGLAVLMGLLCMGQRKKMVPFLGMLLGAAAVAGTFLTQV